MQDKLILGRKNFKKRPPGPLGIPAKRNSAIVQEKKRWEKRNNLTAASEWALPIAKPASDGLLHSAYYAIFFDMRSYSDACTTSVSPIPQGATEYVTQGACFFRKHPAIGTGRPCKL
jgi:hypothetical protein